VIMAGGIGSRLAPYTTVLPKPLMPIGDRPIIDVIIRQLIQAGVDSIHISVGHLGSLIESWVTGAASYEVPISFLYEEEPLGTAGALQRLAHEGDAFLAMNGDILTTLPFGDLVARHHASGCIAMMGVKERSVQVEYGVVHTADDGEVVRLEEKPELRYTVSIGVYAFDPAIAALIAPGERIDFPDLLMRAMTSGRPVATYPYDGYWRDIGNRADYEAALIDFASDPERFLPGAQSAE
jgi:NDP-mannose synthase